MVRSREAIWFFDARREGARYFRRERRWVYDWRSERGEALDVVVTAWEEGDGSEDEGAVSGDGGVGARRVEKSSSLAINSSRDWMVESPRWSVGSSSDSEPEDVFFCFSPFGARASLMISCSADLAKGGPEYLRGALFCNFGRADTVLGLSLCIRSAAPSLPLPSSFSSWASDGVGIGGPRPPVGRGVSIQAPVIRGVFRLISALEICDVSSIV